MSGAGSVSGVGTNGAALPDADRAAFARLADLLIPEGEGMPAASAADVETTGVDRVFSVRPDLVAPVEGMLAVVRAAEPATFDELYAVGSEHFSGFAEAVTAAYFLNPAVAEKVGYRKRSVIPIVFDTDLDALVSTVVSRGPIYRPTPGASPQSASFSGDSPDNIFPQSKNNIFPQSKNG